MSDSYPTIQDALSETQKEFMGCVEMHLDDSPEHRDPLYCIDALFRADDGSGTAVRFCVTVDETDPDISERQHVIEFLPDIHAEQPVARVMHSMKRVEASQGRYFWTESRFRVAGPEVPDRRAPATEVEQEVRAYVDRVRALDRERKLVEVS